MNPKFTVSSSLVARQFTPGSLPTSLATMFVITGDHVMNLAFKCDIGL